MQLRFDLGTGNASKTDVESAFVGERREKDEEKRSIERERDAQIIIIRLKHI